MIDRVYVLEGPMETAWYEFSKIMDEKHAMINSQLQRLKEQVATEDRQLDERIAKYRQEWMQHQPQDGSLDVNAALRILANFEDMLNVLIQDTERNKRAKEALDMEAVSVESRLGQLPEDVADFKQVYIVFVIGIFMK